MITDSRKIKIPYQKRWTKLKSAQKVVQIQYAKLWSLSSGPKTAARKSLSAQYAGRRGAEGRALLRALRAQKRWIRQVDHLTLRLRQGRAFPPIIERRLIKAGWEVLPRFSRAVGIPDLISQTFQSCNIAQQ